MDHIEPGLIAQLRGKMSDIRVGKRLHEFQDHPNYEDWMNALVTLNGGSRETEGKYWHDGQSIGFVRVLVAMGVPEEQILSIFLLTFEE